MLLCYSITILQSNELWIPKRNLFRITQIHRHTPTRAHTLTHTRAQTHTHTHIDHK